MPQIPTNNKEDGGIIMMKTGDRGPGTTHTLSCVLFLRALAHSVLRQVWIPVFMKEAKEFQRAQELSDRAGKSETEAKTHHEPQRALGVSTLGEKSHRTPGPGLDSCESSAASSEARRLAPVGQPAHRVVCPPHPQPGVQPKRDPYRSLFRAILGGSRLGFSMDSICGHRRK